MNIGAVDRIYTDRRRHLVSLADDILCRWLTTSCVAGRRYFVSLAYDMCPWQATHRVVKQMRCVASRQNDVFLSPADDTSCRQERTFRIVNR